MKYSYLIVPVTILTLIGIGIHLEFGHHTFGGLYMENGHIIIISIPIIILGLLNKHILFLGLTIFLSGLLTFVGTSIILVEQEYQSAENAKGIVKALNSYNADNGVYPTTLEELIPNYLTTIPMTAMGISDHAFTYRRLEDSYFLSFPENEKHYYYRVLGDKLIHPCAPVGC